MSMGTSSTRRVETDALIMVVGCQRKRQRMRQPKNWIWAKGQTEYVGLRAAGASAGQWRYAVRQSTQEPWQLQEDIGCGSESERSTLHGTNVDKTKITIVGKACVVVA